jgi:outer membrane protein assembly factor BamB
LDQIEQETLKDDPAIEAIDLPSTEGKSNVVAPLAGARPNADPTGVSPAGASSTDTSSSPAFLSAHVNVSLTSASPASIWRNWPLVTAAGILLLLVVVILPALPTIRGQLSQHTSSTSSVVHATPTPTPILSPLSGSHSVNPTVANGAVYIGASDGAVTAVRVSDGKLLWQYKTSGAAYAPLVINDVVYASDYVGNNGPAHMYALRESDGKLLWSYTRKDFINEPIVVDGVAYLTSNDGLLAAVRAEDGAMLWRHNLKGQGVVIAEVINGVIYGEVFGNQGPNHVDAWRASDGSRLWQSSDHLAILDMIDGIVYAALDNNFGTLQASTGAVLWRTKLGGAPFYAPVIVNNGVVYLVATNISYESASTPAHNGGYALRAYTAAASLQKTVPEKKATSLVYALRVSDGTVLWHYKGDNSNGWPQSMTMVDGVVYATTSISSSEGYVYALQGSTGALLWNYAAGSQVYAMTVDNGLVYAGVNGGILVALRANNASVLWRYQSDGSNFGTPIVDNGSVFVGADNGITYALQAGTGVLRWYFLAKVPN